MVLELTMKCREGCSHCFVDATPQGSDMSLATVKQAGDFIDSLGIRVVQISGGEFTLHPNYVARISWLAGKLHNSFILLESNGWWFEDQETVKNILELLSIPNIFGLQIRTDQRYYPNYQRIWSHRKQIEAIHPKISVFEGEIELIPLGRAKNLIKDNPSKSPMCSNLYLVASQRPSATLGQVVQLLESFGKFSTPCIDTDGSLHAGESRLCKEIGNVWEPQDVIMSRLKGGPCGKCNLKMNFGHLRQY